MKKCCAATIWAAFVPGVNILTKDAGVPPVIAGAIAKMVSIAAQSNPRQVGFLTYKTTVAGVGGADPWAGVAGGALAAHRVRNPRGSLTMDVLQEFYSAA